MFLLFYSLFRSMFYGEWEMIDNAGLKTQINAPINAIGKLLTSIFGNNTYDTFSTDMYTSGNGYYSIVAFILALITSIGIVVMAVKGVKKAFGIFFGQIR